MGSGLSRESSPEFPAIVRAATPLTAHEETKARTTMNPAATTANSAAPPAPPSAAPSRVNPRQQMLYNTQDSAAPPAPPAEQPQLLEAASVTSARTCAGDETVSASLAVPSGATDDTAAAEAVPRVPLLQPTSERASPHEEKSLPPAMPPHAPLADAMDVSLSSPSSPSVSSPTSDVADAGELDIAGEHTLSLKGTKTIPDTKSPTSSPSPPPPEPVAQPTPADDADTREELRDHSAMTLNCTTYRPLARSVSPAAGLEKYAQLPLQTVQTTLKTNHRVLRICLTGGPCAGKSTMLAQFQSKLPQRIGYDVYCVPEAATMLVTGGMRWDGDLIVEQQTALLRTQLALEDQFYALAVATGRPSIIFSDRGTMDGRAFCSDAQFKAILQRLDTTLESLRDRYDAVIHMVTAAIGAEAYYNLDNPARYEDLDGARESDLKLRQMYVGHPSFRLLDNSTTFDDKIEKGLRLAAQIVGVEVPEAEQPVVFHYLLRRACPLPLPVPCASYTTTTTILSNSRMDEIRLLYRRQMADGSSMHFFRSLYKRANAVPPPPPFAHAGHENGLVRRSHSSTASSASLPSHASASTQHYHRKSVGAWSPNGSIAMSNAAQARIDTCQRISSKEYVSLLNHRDPMREDVIVEATQFFHNNVSLELITILTPSWAAGKQTMTVESTEGAMTTFTFPDFVDVDREVPVDASTTAFLISHRETGPLYTSLAFAPVFSRTVTAIGAHADVHDMASTTCDSSTVQQAASQLNTPLRPLQSLRQSSVNSGKHAHQNSFREKSSAADAAKRRKDSADASPACSQVLSHVPTRADAIRSDASVDKENAVPAQTVGTAPSQQGHTPLAPVSLFHIRTSGFHTSPTTVSESVSTAAPAPAAISGLEGDGGEVRESGPPHTSAPSGSSFKRPLALSPLHQGLLPAIGQRFPAHPTPSTAV